MLPSYLETVNCLCILTLNKGAILFSLICNKDFQCIKKSSCVIHIFHQICVVIAASLLFLPCDGLIDFVFSVMIRPG
jgi:hypothetical protein